MKFKKLRRRVKTDAPRVGRWLKRHRLRTKAKAIPSRSPLPENPNPDNDNE